MADPATLDPRSDTRTGSAPGRAIPTAFVVATALGAALVVATDVIEPHSGDGAPSLVTTVAAHPDRWMVGYSLQIVAALLLGAGLLGFALVVPGRGARLTRTGVAVTTVGLMGFACQAATELMLVPVVGDGGAQGTLDAVERMDSSAALVVVFLLYLPATFFGPMLLGFGLARARRTTWWTAGALAVATFAAFALSGSVAGTLALAAQMGLLVALGLWMTGTGRVGAVRVSEA